MSSTTATTSSSSARLTSAAWWFCDKNGHLTLWQAPNAALCVWLASFVLSRLNLTDAHQTAVVGVGHGALLVWSLDEVVRGASPFRRVLGAVVFVAQLAVLVRA